MFNGVKDGLLQFANSGIHKKKIRLNLCEIENKK